MKICLLGNGLTAIVLAKIFADKNLEVHNFIKNEKIRISKLRTVGISINNIKFLEKYYPNITKLGNAINEIKIYNDRDIKNQILNFNNQGTTKFYIFKYEKLYKFLKEKYFNNKKIRIIKNNNNNIYSRNTKNNYDLIVDTELNSLFARKNFFSSIKKNYQSHAYVTLIKHDKIKNNIARQVFTRNGPIAFLPLNNSITSVVLSFKKIEKQLKKKDLFDLIKKYNNEYSNINFKNFETFKLKFSIMRKYYFQNVLAFGDKLHTIHPLAGQGFNMTLRDIIELSKIIDENIQLGLPINKSVSREFEKKMRYKNTIFSNGIDLIHELFLIENKFPNTVVKNFFNLFNKNKFFNKYTELIANKGINF